jgi:ABC-type sugar transport system substrate-binding protein
MKMIFRKTAILMLALLLAASVKITAFASENGINFGAFRTIAHTPTEITNNVLQFNEFAEECGVNVRYCDPYTYFDVLAQSGQAVEITK